MAIRGQLEELRLADLLQLVSAGGKTGAFELVDGPRIGRIYLRGGKMVHAVVGDTVGEEAVYELLLWQAGRFAFDPEATTDAVSIEVSNHSLLMEGARRIDELQVLRKRIPSNHLVPVFKDGGGASQVSFTPREWAVVRRIDEQSDIEQLAVALEMPPFELQKVLYGLLASNVLELRDPAAPVPVAAAPVVPAPATPVPASAPPPAAGAAPASPAFDFRPAARRAAALIDGAIGLDGKAIVAAIDKATTVEDLLKALDRGLEQVQRLGRFAAATGLSAEIAALRKR